MAKNALHSKIILSLESLIKFNRGNLLGEKRKEFEVHLDNSPLMKDAADGLAEFEREDKLPKTVEQLNDGIALRLKATSFGTFNPSAQKTKPNVKGPVLAKLKIVTAVAASLVLLAAIGFGVFYLADRSSDQKPLSQVNASKETIISDGDERNKDQVIKSYEQLAAELDSAKTDSANGDTITLAVSDLQRALDQETEADSDDVQGNANTESSVQASETTNRAQQDLRERERLTANEPKAAEANKAAETPPEVSYEEAVEPEVAQTRNQAPEKAATINADSVSDKKDGYGGASTLSKSAVSETQKLYNDGLAHLKKGQYSEAIAKLEKVADDKDAKIADDAAWHLVDAYLATDDTRKAKRLLRKLSRTDKYGEKADEKLNKL